MSTITLLFILLSSIIALIAVTDGYTAYKEADTIMQQIYAALCFIIFTISTGFIIVVIQINSALTQLKKQHNENKKTVQKENDSVSISESAMTKHLQEKKENIIDNETKNYSDRRFIIAAISAFIILIILFITVVTK